MPRLIVISLIFLVSFYSVVSAAGVGCLSTLVDADRAESVAASHMEDCDHESCPMHAAHAGHGEHKHGAAIAKDSHDGTKAKVNIKCCRHGVDALVAFTAFDATISPAAISSSFSDAASPLFEKAFIAVIEPPLSIDRPPKV